MTRIHPLCCGLLQSVLKGIIALRTTPAAQSVTAAPLDLTSSTTVTSLLTVGTSSCQHHTLAICMDLAPTSRITCVSSVHRMPPLQDGYAYAHSETCNPAGHCGLSAEWEQRCSHR